MRPTAQSADKQPFSEDSGSILETQDKLFWGTMYWTILRCTQMGLPLSRVLYLVTFAGRVTFSWTLGSPRILLNTTPEGNNIFETLMNKSNRQNKLFPNFHPKWSFPPPPTWPSLLSLSVSAHFMHDSRPPLLGRRLNGFPGLSLNERTILLLVILLDKTVSVG